MVCVLAACVLVVQWARVCKLCNVARVCTLRVWCRELCECNSTPLDCTQCNSELTFGSDERQALQYFLEFDIPDLTITQTPLCDLVSRSRYILSCRCSLYRNGIGTLGAK